MGWLCPVCDETHSNSFATKSTLPLRRCTGCLLVHLDQPQDPGRYFNKVEAEFFSNGYLRRRDLFSERFLIHKTKRRMRVIQRFKSSGRLLDIGCGTGELIYVANQLGYQAEGLEYSQSLAEYVRVKYGVSVYCGDLATVNVLNRYDIVVMSHMLEHTVDPLITLQNIAKLLNPGGILYVAVPNIDCWEARFRGWGSYEPYHLWYFNSVGLRRLIEKVGYEVVDIHTWEPYSAWLNTIIRSLLPQKHAAVRTAVHHDCSGRLRYPFIALMGLLNAARFVSGLLLTPLRKFQEKLGKGEELIEIAVWKKSGVNTMKKGDNLR